jgi:hypothetical protein
MKKKKIYIKEYFRRPRFSKKSNEAKNKTERVSGHSKYPSGGKKKKDSK